MKKIIIEFEENIAENKKNYLNWNIQLRVNCLILSLIQINHVFLIDKNDPIKFKFQKDINLLFINIFEFL